jgi:uncharacterized phosphatase
LRHGRTAWNAEERYQGRTDVPLDDVGRVQSADMGRLERLRNGAAIVLAGSPRRPGRWRIEA